MITIWATVVATTDAAIGIEHPHTGDTVFLPRSQIEVSDPDPDEGDDIQIDVPRWLALREDLE